MALTKSAGLILELINKNLHICLNNKSVVKIWIIIKDRFQHILPMSINSIFSDTYNVKLSDCKDVVDYTRHYQIAFDKILSLINNNKDSWISMKIIEITL